MEYPIQCFCGTILADKYQYYIEEVRQRKMLSKMDVKKVIYLTDKNTEKTIQGVVMDELKLNKQCCRMHMMNYQDI